MNVNELVKALPKATVLTVLSLIVINFALPYTPASVQKLVKGA